MNDSSGQSFKGGIFTFEIVFKYPSICGLSNMFCVFKIQ